MRQPLHHFYLRRQSGGAAFTLVEVLISLLILTAFFLASTATLNLFDTRAAKNRNAEAARVAVDDYVNLLLTESTAVPVATGDGTDVDGDGVPDGVLCTLAHTPASPNPMPLIVTRTASPNAMSGGTFTNAVVIGTLYWRVQPVGTAYGLASNNSLVQVNFCIAYTFRSQTYYYKAVTFKSGT